MAHAPELTEALIEAVCKKITADTAFEKDAVQAACKDLGVKVKPGTWSGWKRHGASIADLDPDTYGEYDRLCVALHEQVAEAEARAAYEHTVRVKRALATDHR